MADTCGDERGNLGFTFSTIRSGLMIFNDSTDQVLTLQGHEIASLAEYRYLGVWVTEGQTYVEKHG